MHAMHHDTDSWEEHTSKSKLFSVHHFLNWHISGASKDTFYFT